MISGPEWQYRNRSQFHIRDGHLGYLKAGSHELVPIEKCPISSPMLNECIAALNDMLKDRRFPQFVKEIELFTNETDTQVNVLETEPARRSIVLRLGSRAHSRIYRRARSRIRDSESATSRSSRSTDFWSIRS